MRMYAAVDNGYTVEEVDVLTGPMIGNPKTGTFRLADLVGLDVMAHVTSNLLELRKRRREPRVLQDAADHAELIDAKSLGNKSGIGFYKTVQTPAAKSFGPSISAPANTNRRQSRASRCSRKRASSIWPTAGG